MLLPNSVAPTWTSCSTPLPHSLPWVQGQNGAVPSNSTGNGSKAGGKGDLTVQCALEGACVLLERDTLLSDALTLLDEAEQSVALIVSP